VPRILVVGGGIAGLTLAAALRRRGMDPTVVEKVPRYGDVGYVIGLWPMGRRVLEHLELGRRFKELTVPVNNYVIHADGGGLLRRFDFGTRLGDDVPRVLKRAALLELLRSCDRGIEVRMARTVEQVEQADQVVRVRFDDGAIGEYDLVVGADGIASGLRRPVVGEVSVRSTGLRHAYEPMIGRRVTRPAPRQGGRSSGRVDARRHRDRGSGKGRDHALCDRRPPLRALNLSTRRPRLPVRHLWLLSHLP
jgi:2-polyprenyl-6-methoxyphenol hydroxylase-like FAD-dependent oxidoreductase